MAALVHLGLGSNLGEREAILRAAVDAVRELAEGKEVRLSSFWESKPVGFAESVPLFLNAVAKFHYVSGRAGDRSAEKLLAELQAIEQHFGRRRESAGSKPASRPLDLDILAFSKLRQSSAPELPHPRAHQRLFVLLPLQEVSPGFRFPGREGQTLDELINAAPKIEMWRL